MVEVEPGELGRELTLEIAISSTGGPDLANSGEIRFQKHADEDHIENSPYYAPVAWGFGFNVTQVGAYEVAISSDGLVLDLVRFGIRLPRQ